MKKSLVMITVTLVSAAMFGACQPAQQAATSASAQVTAESVSKTAAEATAESSSKAVEEEPAAADDDEYPISESNMDMNGCLVKINTEGFGDIAVADEDHELKFDEQYPIQSSVSHLKKGVVLKIGAKPGEGFKFSKWKLNGEDYSMDAETTYTVDSDVELIAVFESETGE